MLNKDKYKILIREEDGTVTEIYASDISEVEAIQDLSMDRVTIMSSEKRLKAVAKRQNEAIKKAHLKFSMFNG